jgi:glyoxylase-like metal-dependent hydrolase (beta-lactamase superfamily II)
VQIGIIPVTAFQQNCSVLHCQETNKGAVVDPGGDLERVLAHIRDEGVEIEKILLTHAHIDHAGATKALRDALKVPIIGPEREDEFLIEGIAMQGQMFGLGHAEPFVPDRWLQQGDQVSVGNELFEVRHCPGHTPGHVIFYSAARKFALVGDVLFDGSIGRTDLPRGDHVTLLKSIKEQLLSLPDDTTFLPGHGPTSTIGAQRRHNPFLRGL